MKLALDSGRTEATLKTTYGLSATRGGRSYDIDDCGDDVATIEEAREWAAARIGDLTASERVGLRVWIDEHTSSGAVRCVETVLVPE